MLKSELIFTKSRNTGTDIIVGQCWFRLCLLCRGSSGDRLRRVAVFPSSPGSGVILRSGPVAFSSHVPWELEP